MNIDTAVGRHVEYGLRQDEAIGGDDHRLGARSADSLLHKGISQCRRLKYLEPRRVGQFLDRRGSQSHPAPGGPIRLRQHQHHLVASSQDLPQGQRSEFRRTREDQPHAVIRACLASLFLMRNCFNCERCSTKTRPCRWSISCCRQTANRPVASTVCSAPSRSW